MKYCSKTKMEHFGIFAYVGRGSDETHPPCSGATWGVCFVARLYAGEKLSVVRSTVSFHTPIDHFESITNIP